MSQLRLSIFAAVIIFAADGGAQTLQTSTLSDQPAEAVTTTSPNPESEPVPEPAQTGAPVSESVRRFHYTLTINVAEIYDSNLTLSPFNKIEDYFTRIGGSLRLSFGDTVGRQDNFIEFDYQPAVLIFADNSNFNNVEHVAHLAGQYHFSRLTLGAVEDFQIVETGDSQISTFSGTVVGGVNVDAGGRRRINTYTSHLTAAYDLTGKTFLSAAGDYSLIDYSDTLIDSNRISGDVFLNYRYGPKLTVGIGGTAGHDFLDQPNTDQTFEQGNLRATYSATDKLSANGSVGVELRQFDMGGNDSVSPVFNLTATYTPFDGTNISLTASRLTLNSAGQAGQDYASTQFQVSAQQRLLQRFLIGLTAGYQNLDYFDASSTSIASRRDNYYFLQPAIDVRITNFWFAGAFFVHRKNTSNVSNFSFDDTQAGIRTTLKF
jgi:hypothetical protein